VQAYVNRAITRRDRSERDLALQDLDAALTLSPRHLQAYDHRVAVHLTLGAYEQALKDIQQILALDPGHARAQSALTRVQAILASPPQQRTAQIVEWTL
jgi:tetratricopeptide (TPR) repeat protein